MTTDTGFVHNINSLAPLNFHKPCPMNSRNPQQEGSSLVRFFRQLFGKLAKPQEEYPVRYYKKNRHPDKHRPVSMNN